MAQQHKIQHNTTPWRQELFLATTYCKVLLTIFNIIIRVFLFSISTAQPTHYTRKTHSLNFAFSSFTTQYYTPQLRRADKWFVLFLIRGLHNKNNHHCCCGGKIGRKDLGRIIIIVIENSRHSIRFRSILFLCFLHHKLTTYLWTWRGRRQEIIILHHSVVNIVMTTRNNSASPSNASGNLHWRWFMDEFNSNIPNLAPPQTKVDLPNKKGKFTLQYDVPFHSLCSVRSLLRVTTILLRNVYYHSSNPSFPPPCPSNPSWPIHPNRRCTKKLSSGAITTCRKTRTTTNKVLIKRELGHSTTPQQ